MAHARARVLPTLGLAAMWMLSAVSPALGIVILAAWAVILPVQGQGHPHGRPQPIGVAPCARGRAAGGIRHRHPPLPAVAVIPPAVTALGHALEAPWNVATVPEETIATVAGQGHRSTTVAGMVAAHATDLLHIPGQGRLTARVTSGVEGPPAHTAGPTAAVATPAPGLAAYPVDVITPARLVTLVASAVGGVVRVVHETPAIAVGLAPGTKHSVYAINW